MANFIPLKNYMFYCLEEIIKLYQLQPPFLDVGCGIGDLSCYLAAKNWQGKSIDFSEIAIQKSQINLQKFPLVTVEKKSLLGAGQSCQNKITKYLDIKKDHYAREYSCDRQTSLIVY